MLGKLKPIAKDYLQYDNILMNFYNKVQLSNILVKTTYMSSEIILYKIERKLLTCNSE